MEPNKVKCFVKAQAPVNIAVIKYWGKKDELLKIPINDSLSGTLSIDDMCTTTCVYLSEQLDEDELILNDKKQSLTSDESPARKMLQDLRDISKQKVANQDYSRAKVRIISHNNFPTAAGLASSAAGYACLAYALGHTYGITDTELLSRVARKGSGSACRSLFGGFVHWSSGRDHATSMASQVANHQHWPEMRVVICVANDGVKDVSSSYGMARSVESSELLKYRSESIVPKRISAIKEAILKRDFERFADITMQDSNQFHAICLDTYPPIFYLNETSKQIIKICSTINEFYGSNRVAYTFDAGPNACIYLLEECVSEFIEAVRCFFPSEKLEIRGKSHSESALDNRLKERLLSNVCQIPNGVKYIINTSIGDGPKLLECTREEQ